ncbi:MAG: hypothetical protein ACK5CY_08525 [Bacteroidia bacterium]|jgi:uncharacterized membrane protein
MTPSHYHLVLNHFPVVTSVIAFLILSVGLILKNKTINVCGLSLTLLGGIFTIPAFVTGEGAEEQIETFADVSHNLIHEHEEMAELLIWLVSFHALFAACILYFIWRSRVISTYIHLLNLVFSLVICFFFFRTAHSGGHIRHPEMEATTPLSVPSNDQNTERSHDED